MPNASMRLARSAPRGCGASISERRSAAGDNALFGAAAASRASRQRRRGARGRAVGIALAVFGLLPAGRRRPSGAASACCNSFSRARRRASISSGRIVAVAASSAAASVAAFGERLRSGLRHWRRARASSSRSAAIAARRRSRAVGLARQAIGLARASASTARSRGNRACAARSSSRFQPVQRRHRAAMLPRPLRSRAVVRDVGRDAAARLVQRRAAVGELRRPPARRRQARRGPSDSSCCTVRACVAGAALGSRQRFDRLSRGQLRMHRVPPATFATRPALRVRVRRAGSSARAAGPRQSAHRRRRHSRPSATDSPSRETSRWPGLSSGLQPRRLGRVDDADLGKAAGKFGGARTPRQQAA